MRKALCRPKTPAVVAASVSALLLACEEDRFSPVRPDQDPFFGDVLGPAQPGSEEETPLPDILPSPAGQDLAMGPADAPHSRDEPEMPPHLWPTQDPGPGETKGPHPEGQGEEPPRDPCESGLFEVTGLEWMGGSFEVEARAGASLLAVWHWSLANPPDGPDGPRPLVLGIEETPGPCVVAPSAPPCPDWMEGDSMAALKAPDRPGTFTLYAAAPRVPNCVAARAAFRDDPSRVPIGVIRVPGDESSALIPEPACEPTACRSLDKECGLWGDGCGHALDCGACAEGESCTLAGRCKGPCSDGVLEVADLRLAGSGPVASAHPDDPVDLHLRLRVANPATCPDCPRFAALGWDLATPECLDLNPVARCPEVTEVLLDRRLPTPEGPGPHALFLAAPPDARNCQEALQAFARSSRRTRLASLAVHPSCHPFSCDDLERQCGPVDDGCGLQLACGHCAPGDLCSHRGQCGCDGSDPYEPNDSPAAAHSLGEAPDRDIDSRQTLRGSLFRQEDWFSIAVLDQSLSVVDPFVRIRTDLPTMGTVTTAYVCRNGKRATLLPLADSDCQTTESLDLGPGLTGVPAIRCPLDAASTTIHFEPTCPGGADDSGTLLVGLSHSSPCTAWTMDLHL